MKKSNWVFIFLSTLFIISCDGDIFGFSENKNNLIKTFKGHTEGVNSLAVTPDGKYIISGSIDQTLKLWDINTGTLIRTFQVDSGSIATVAITPNGKHIISGSSKSIMKLWDINTGILIRTFNGDTGYIRKVIVTPNGQYVISVGYDLQLWDINTGELIRDFKGQHSTRSAILTPDGQHILSGGLGTDNIVQKWDINTGELLNTFKGRINGVKPKIITSNWEYENRVEPVGVTTNGKYIIVNNGGDTLKLWDITTGEETKVFNKNVITIRSVAISPDGKYIVSGEGEGERTESKVKLWDINTGKIIRTFGGHRRAVLSVTVTPDGKYIVSGGYDDNVKLWHMGI